MKIKLINIGSWCVLALAILFTISLINPHFALAQDISKNNVEPSAEDCKKCQENHLENHIPTCPTPYLINKFGVTNSEVEAANLDVFFTELNNNPDSVGYIVGYGGRTNKFGEFKERTKRLETYIKIRKYDPSRIKIVHGGFREKFEFEFWISPIKDSFPLLSPTIEPEKVKFKGLMKPLHIEY